MKVLIVLVSGRSARGALRVAGAGFDGILGNHGAELLVGGRIRPWAGSGARAAHRAFDSLASLAQEYRPPLRVEFKGHSIAVHHRLPPGQVERLLRQVRRAVNSHGLIAFRGRRVIDIRAPGADKGTAVLKWMRQSGIRPAQVLYAGDDTTDEDAFRVLRPPALTLAVGRRPVGAAFRTSNPAALARCLARLETLRARSRRPGSKKG